MKLHPECSSSIPRLSNPTVSHLGHCRDHPGGVSTSGLTPTEASSHTSQGCLPPISLRVKAKTLPWPSAPCEVASSPPAPCSCPPWDPQTCPAPATGPLRWLCPVPEHPHPRGQVSSLPSLKSRQPLPLLQLGSMACAISFHSSRHLTRHRTHLVLPFIVYLLS